MSTQISFSRNLAETITHIHLSGGKPAFAAGCENENVGTNRTSVGKLGVLTLLALFFLSVGNAKAQRQLTNIPKPDIARELKEFKLAPNLSINLFASDPDIAKPIQINWDSRGRLWVASSSIYPQLKPGQKVDDKIVIVEDTDGDGKSDKRIVFADDLLIPTGVMPYKNGAYVANSTELLFLEDTNNDGKADKKTVVLTGFGTEDTHHILHTFRWGVDGCLYINQSIYIHTHLETPWGPRTLMGGGIWQYRPTNFRAEVYARGFVNAWGHVFDRWGQSLCTDGAFGEGVNHVFPGAAFVTAVDAPRILKGLSPGQPKHCGLEIITGQHFPPEWQGQFVTNDFRGNRINRFALTPEGSSYVARQLPDVVSSTNVAFRPVDVRIGPDGALYVADWYNPIIQHGEVDFRDPRRDHAHGRIWRITYSDRALVKKADLSKASIEELLTGLKAPEALTREKTKIELRERKSEEVLPKLVSFWTTLDPKDAGYEQDRLEALWTYQTLDVVEPSLLNNVLASTQPFARAAGVRVLSGWSDRIPDTKTLLAKLAVDENPRVRLEAVTALRLLGDAESVRLALAALDKEVDSNLDYAIWLAARETQKAWLDDLTAGKPVLGDDLKKILFALKATDSAKAVMPLVRMIKDNKVPMAELPAVLDLAGKLGGPGELTEIWRIAKSTQESDKIHYFTALETAARDRKVQPSQGTPGIATYFNEGPEELRATAVRLAGRWKESSAIPSIHKSATDEKASAPFRAACIEALSYYGSNAEVKLLEELSEKAAPAFRAVAIRSLASIRPQRAARATIAFFNDPHFNQAELQPMLAPFLASKAGPETLAQALKNAKVNAATAESALRIVTSSGRDLPGLVNALRTAGGITGMNLASSPSEISALVNEVRKSGDPARGEAIYRREKLQCMKCHTIGGVGGNVGPDLVSIGSSAQIDYLIESMLEPSKKIKEGFNTVSVVKDDGSVVSGLLVSRTEKEIRIRDANAVELAIPSEAIEMVRQSPVSLMPQDLMKPLPRGEFVDLVRFLSELGKDGPYKVGPQRFVRRWQVLTANPAAAHLITRVGNQALLEGQPGIEWKPAYSFVSGELPLADLPTHRHFVGQELGFARFDLEATTPGRIALKWNDPAGVKLWLGKSEVLVKPTTILDVPKGISTVTLLIEKGVRKSGLLVEVVDVEGSKARARAIGGR